MVRANTRSAQQRVRRGGAVTVEAALVLPIFIVFLAGLMEFGHVFLVQHMLNGAARRGAHLGSFEGVTTDQVQTKVTQILNASFQANKATILVKNASIFDTAGVNPTTVNYNTLPAIELTSAKTGDPFLVQIQVPYDNIALLPPFWVKGKTLTGRAIMRHE